MQELNDERQYPDGHLVAGDFYFYRTRDFDAARAQYEAGQKAFPKEKAIYQKRLVELLATTGKNAEANQLLAAILKDNPKDNDAIAMRAALMLHNRRRGADQPGRQRSAVAGGEGAGESPAALQPGARVSGEERYRTGAAATGSGHQASSRFCGGPRNAGAHLPQQEGLRQGFEGSRRYHRHEQERSAGAADPVSALMAIGDKKKARDELEGILQMAPNNPDARYQSGILAWQDKDYKRAQECLRN